MMYTHQQVAAAHGGGVAARAELRVAAPLVVVVACSACISMYQYQVQDKKGGIGVRSRTRRSYGEVKCKQKANRKQLESKQEANRTQSESKQEANRKQTEIKQKANRKQTERKQKTNRKQIGSKQEAYRKQNRKQTESKEDANRKQTAAKRMQTESKQQGSRKEAARTSNVDCGLARVAVAFVRVDHARLEALPVAAVCRDLHTGGACW
jgi:hypothetical protein